MAHSQLSDAIENTGEAFSIYSADGELQLANRQFRNFFPNGRTPESESVNAFVEQLADGRWVQTMVRKTSRGGLVSTHADITALKQQEMELISARRQAEGANHAKSQFLAVMSHELRTPLNSIIGFAELISRTDMHIQTDTMREYGALILESGRHLLGLISGILDLSRIEAGRYELHEESIDLEFLAQSAVSQCRPMAEEAKVTIEVDAPSDLPHLWAEMRALRQILFNLLSNAIKFTPEDGKVTVTFQYQDGHIVTCVRDTGIGIDEKDQELVFQAFQQVDNTLSREHPGSGLGLPLVKHLAELHGAVVTLDSQLGKGSCFTVTFPKDRVMALTEDSLS
ncbi:hypothetical protein GCM10007972_25520 [Iodidimonas muriae]|uniref:histidine kinase n=1 Tax=Iodidimonas muriae TaxID=261467 RepID=A0ABQ2LG43_9PROT|nr:HAMP domain-containing sensor histidine kinase [Iodidimonas muriae]GGO16437.1 hypothetical protein GCM10007972_25520 [Iodidimonas muriae]